MYFFSSKFTKPYENKIEIDDSINGVHGVFLDFESFQKLVWVLGRHAFHDTNLTSSGDLCYFGGEICFFNSGYFQNEILLSFFCYDFCHFEDIFMGK